MKIGLVQLNTGRDTRINISQMQPLLNNVRGADLVVTPECTNIMGFDPSSARLKLEQDDEIIKFLREWASQNATPVLIGSALVYDDMKSANVNRQLLIDASGAIVNRYDKIHMFDVDLPNGESFHESERFRAGQVAKTTSFQDVKIGHTICYDLRFPSLYRRLAQGGAQVIVVPAAFTQLTGRAHWEVLLRARAIENGAFIVAPAQTGLYIHQDGSQRYTYGHSMVIGPWGQVIAQLRDTVNARMVEIDLHAVEQVRAQIPSLHSDHDFTYEAY